MKAKFERIADHWTRISNTDLGSSINPIVDQALNFFMECGYGRTTHQIELYAYPDLAKLLRAFAIENPDLDGDEIIIAEALDLNHVTITDFAAEEFDFWLMMNKRFIDKYHYALGMR